MQTSRYQRIDPAHASRLSRLLAWLGCALLAGGCQGLQLPRIDPSGERLFVAPGTPQPTSPYANTPYGTSPPFNPQISGQQAPLPGTTIIAPPVVSAPPTAAPSALPPGISSPMVQSPLQTPQPMLPAAPPMMGPRQTIPPPGTGAASMPGNFASGAPGQMMGVAPVAASPGMGAPSLLGMAGAPHPGLSVQPGRIVAPVGSEVVVLASLLGNNGAPLTGQEVEWMLTRDGVGTFLSPGERGTFECLNRLRGLPKKVDATYVINSTSRRHQRLDRGTPVAYDDVEVQPGQAWVTLSSPVEGNSYLTAFAPGVAEWDRRQQTATVHWVDAQWTFPPPSVNPVGTAHQFVTSVSRQSDGSPLSGWTVRYEIAGGPAAEWRPNGGTVIDVTTNELGQAVAEIAQVEPRDGTSQVNVQIIRPDDRGARGIPVGSGTTFKTWTQANICIETVGQLQAAVGTEMYYRLEVTNPSGVTATNVVVTDQAPRNITFVRSSVPSDASPSGQEWRLGTVVPGEKKIIEVTYKLNEAGNFNYCANVSADGGLAARDCLTTNAQGSDTRPLDIRVNGPTSANVGSQVTFEVEVINASNRPATGLVVTDTFDAGLEHNVSASPIERDLRDLQPGQTERFNITFRVTRPGQLCQLIEVRGSGGLQSSTRYCVTAIAPPGAGRDRDPGGVTEQDDRDRTERSAPSTERGILGPRFDVRKTGPVRQRVGEAAEFVIEVTNTGDVTLNNLRVADNYDPSLDPTEATGGYVISGGSLVWNMGSLPPGKTIRLRVNCRCLRAARTACNRVSVSADGLTAVGDEACLEITDAGAPGPTREDESRRPAAITPNPIQPGEARPIEPTFEPRRDNGGTSAPDAGGQDGITLSVDDQPDPVRIGAETQYQVVVANRGTAGDRQVALRVEIPAMMTFAGVEGPVRAKLTDRTVEFEPIAEIRPNESITFQIRARGASAGSGRLIATVTSENRRTGLRAEEPTEVVE